MSTKGAYVRTADASRLVECSTGQAWTVTDGGAAEALKTAYASAGRKSGEPLLVSVQAHLELSRATEPTVTVDWLGPVLASETCAPRFAAAPLDGTTWSLRWLSGSAVVPASAGERKEPSLTFRGDAMAFSGSGGCNHLAGEYLVNGELLSMRAAGTLMACPGAEGVDTAFRKAIDNTRTYRILGAMLELMDGDRKVLARFAAK